MAPVAHDESIAERVNRLELPFNEFGVDPYGISKKHLAMAASLLAFLYRHYFRVKCFGIEHVPPRGRAMLVGNHSGGFALDGAMVLASMFLEMEPPRLAQGMAEKFLNRFPVASLWTSRTGQFTGLPEHAERLLEDDRLLMVFPEGARGTAKLYKERYSLVDFGTGFMRLALKTRIAHRPLRASSAAARPSPRSRTSYTLGSLVGVPYIPVTPYLLPLPLPAPVEVHYGEPMIFEGTGDEDDEVIAGYVEQVKARIAELIERGTRAARPEERAHEGPHPRHRRRHRAEAGHAAARRGARGHRHRRRPWSSAPKGIEVHRVDIRKRAAEDVFRRRRPDAVVHMATVTALSVARRRARPHQPRRHPRRLRALPATTA